MFYDLPGPPIVLYLVSSMSFSLLLSLSVFLYLPFVWFLLQASVTFHEVPQPSMGFQGFVLPSFLKIP